MKNLKFWKIELLAASALFAFIIYKTFTVTNRIIHLGKASGMHKPFTDRGIPFNYASDYAHYYLYPEITNYTIIFLAFLFLNFYVLPLFDRGKLGTAVSYTFLSVLISWAVFTLSAAREEAYLNEGFWYFFREGAPVLALLGLYIIYVICKKIIKYYLKEQKTLFHKIIQEFLIAFAIWSLVSLVLNIFFRNGDVIISYWIIFFPFAYLLFSLNLYWLLPSYEKSSKKIGPYLLKLLLTILLFIPFCLLFFPRVSLLHLFIVWISVSFLIVPSAWFAYGRNKLKINALLLRKELGKASANLQFLKSQINPHFLFNALNTLYGTAIQEKAERTSEGIQKLGDMMRFMLHENHQDNILMAKEIEYLRNYIDLQLLRTQSSPDILIDVNITEPVNEHYIAPMLLIPFIENAFKHGISLTKKSWIKIGLHTNEEKLYFDVSNSIHSRTETDPEKHASGIGLENVKQRLNLLYPEKHELIIRETEQEFFIHLTLNFGK